MPHIDNQQYTATYVNILENEIKQYCSIIIIETVKLKFFIPIEKTIISYH